MDSPHYAERLAPDPDVVDVAFAVRSDSPLSASYAYSLYGAIARRLPWIHESDLVGIFPLNGVYADGRIRLNSRSTLRIRIPADLLPRVITLAASTLEIDGAKVRVGVPRVIPLRPAATLYSRFVQVKFRQRGTVTPDTFLESVQKQLRCMGIEARIGIPVWRDGPRAGEPKRRVLHIKGERHVGYALLVQGLTAEESIRLQQHGIGGRRKMGCGLFLPAR